MALYRKLTDEHLKQIKKTWLEMYRVLNSIQSEVATREVALYLQLTNQVLNNLNNELARREADKWKSDLED